jgi:hypothetical protein
MFLNIGQKTGNSPVLRSKRSAAIIPKAMPFFLARFLHLCILFVAQGILVLTDFVGRLFFSLHFNFEAAHLSG